ncbi:hypothetical protein AN219_04630 [Streptomyces nanshensis]|nr:hypothetical protein AN219_04630 [Streptomyces nanshensis]
MQAPVFADVRFVRAFTGHGEITGTPDTYRAGEEISPLQLDPDSDPFDPLSPDATWITEPDASTTCADWLRIPGSALTVTHLWRATTDGGTRR